MSSSSTKALADLPTWDEQGKDSVAKSKPLYEPNSVINSKVSFWFNGNSAALEADAIVNAANSGLYPGGGICGVIHRAAGHKLEIACDKIGGCPTGECVITPGFRLPSKYVIHAVGPIGEKPDLLQMVYENILNSIDGEKIKSVGLCCISTGIYGYPIVPATKIALDVTRKWLENPKNLEKTNRIVFVVYEQKDVNVYKNLAPLYFPLDNQICEIDSLEENDSKTKEPTQNVAEEVIQDKEELGTSDGFSAK